VRTALSALESLELESQGGLDQIDQLMLTIAKEGTIRGDRTDTGTVSLFGYDNALVFKDVGRVFPAVSKKKLAWRAMTSELLWFLSRSTNLYDLKELLHGDRNSEEPTIWDANYNNEGAALGYTDGEMGEIYGYHMAAQLIRVMQQIKEYPEDRRLVMSNWQEDYLDRMTLPPCHGIHTQFYVSDGVLHLNTTMRSTDTFLGLPFNIASYSLMLIIVANMLGLEPGNFKMYLLGDVHIYLNHLEQVLEYVSRPAQENKAYVIVPETLSMEGFQERRYSVDDFKLMDYEHMGSIPAPMAFKKN
jgi:thymidylate synthase